MGLVVVVVAPIAQVTVHADAAAAAAPLVYVSVVIVGKVTVAAQALVLALPQTVTSGNTTLTRLDVTDVDDCHEFDELKRRRA